MAKSIRSKRKRAMRRIKRERYAVKELQRLKDMLANSAAQKEEIVKSFNQDFVEVLTAKDIQNKKEEAENLLDNSTISDSTEGKCSILPSDSGVITSLEDGTDVDNSQNMNDSDINSTEILEGEHPVPSIFEPNFSLDDGIKMGYSGKQNIDDKSMRDKHGNFPAWMNQREIKKLKGKLAIKKEQKLAKNGNWRKTKHKIVRKSLKRKRERRMEQKFKKKY